MATSNRGSSISHNSRFQLSPVLDKHDNDKASTLTCAYLETCNRPNGHLNSIDVEAIKYSWVYAFYPYYHLIPLISS